MGYRGFFVLFAALSAAAAMPFSSGVTGNFRPTYRCRDSSGTFYPIGNDLVRADGYLCNCTYDSARRRTRLECHSPFYRGRNNYLRPGYSTNARATALDHCEYEGRSYNLNSQWTMLINGVQMQCTCNATAYLRCSTGLISSTSSSTHYGGGAYMQGERHGARDEANFKCQTGVFQSGEHFAVLQPGRFFSLCRCVGTTATCQVLTKSGLECQFPFEVGSQLYSTCVSRGLAQAPYCATSSSGARQQRVSDCITTIDELNTYYGYVFTHGGNSNGARCNFPFSVRGVQYNECTTSLNRPLWCATTDNYDRDGRYGLCRGVRSTGSVFNRLGDTVRLDCRYDQDAGDGSPTIRWYKLSSSGRQHIFTFDGAAQSGTVAPTAGIYASRISMPNARQLQIENMRLEDAGTFECDVSYQGTSTSYQHTAVVVGSSPRNFRFTYTPRYGRVRFSWENPEASFDEIRLEYQQVGSTTVSRVQLSPDRDSFVTDRLVPGIEYEARVMTITDGNKATPASMVFSLPRVNYARRPAGSSSVTVPSAEVPLVQPRVKEDEITLNWYSRPIPQTQVTSWVIVYEDATTGESKTVPLDSDVTTYTLSDLKSGTRYRVTLYAVVNDNRIEVGATDVRTELVPVELPGNILPGETTSNTVYVSWPEPEAAVTHYEISYHNVNSPSSARSSYVIPAMANPHATLRNLQPDESYDVHVTPITNGRRGVYSQLVVRTSPSPDQGPVLSPSDLEINDVTRSSFTAVWAAPTGGSPIDHYRVTYETYPAEYGSRPVTTTTYQPVFYASGLEGGKQYVVEVYSVSGSDESTPVSATATTVNEICVVEGKWYGANEKFYKQNPSGYMQNCTCSRKRNGGRWRCDPITCIVNGAYRTVDETWRQLSADRQTYETCTCTLERRADCVSEGEAAPVSSDRLPSIGGEQVLSCPHEAVASVRPIVRWFKLSGNTKTPLYTFYGQQQRGYEASNPGSLAGRLSMANEFELQIEPTYVSDSGTYECTVTYQRSAPMSHRTRITVTSATETFDDIMTLPSTPRTSSVTSDAVLLTWDEPAGDVDSYLIKYRDTTNDGQEQTQVVTGNTVNLQGLLPSTSYRITVIPVLDGVQGRPTSLDISTAQEPATTPAPAPVVAPRPPTNLRFESKGRTSVTARWSAPYYLTPVDSYRIEYHLQGNSDSPISETTRSRYFRLPDLEPGTAYMVKVYSVKGDAESVPLSSVVATNPIGPILVQVANRQRVNRAGEDATLQCRYDKMTPGQPVVTWYKVETDGPQLFFTYDTTTDPDSKTVEEGDYKGRLETTDSSLLTIRNLSGSDHGLYKCKVTYPTGSGSGQTTITVAGAPSPVVITSADVGSDEKKYLLSWTVNAAPRPDSFEIKIRRRGSSSPKYHSFRAPGGALSFLFSGLKPGRTYEGSVTSQNSYGRSADTPFEFTTATSGQPDRPLRIKLSNASPDQVSATVVGPTEGVQFYRIRYVPQTNPSGVPEKQVQGSTPNDLLTLTDLLPNTRYLLTATSVNQNGESEPLQGIFTTPKQLPSSPTGVQIETLEPRRVAFTIEGPMNDVNYYEVTFKPSTSDETARTFRTNPGERTVSLPLEPDTQYTIRINAVNDGGQSRGLQTFIKSPQEESPPSRPIAFTTVQPGTDSVHLAWTGSTEGVQYYSVQYRSVSDTRSSEKNTPGLQQSIIIPNLISDTQYIVSVKAVGQGGHSPKLTEYFRTEPEATLLYPDDVIQVGGSLPNEVTYNLNPSDTVDYYIVRYQLDGESDVQQVTLTGPNITIQGLAPSSRYRITLIPVHDSIETTPVVKHIETAPEQPVTLQPSQPTGIRLTNSTPTHISFSIEGPSDNVDYYHIQFEPISRRGRPKEFDTRGPNNVVTLHDLTPLTRYQLTVTAIKNELASSAINSYFITEKIPDPEPEELSLEPRDARVTDISPNAATLRWNHPEDADSVSRYLVEYKKDQRGDLPYAIRHVAKSTPYAVLSRLSPDTNYVARLSSVGRRGGGSSVSVNFRTLPVLLESTTTPAPIPSVRPSETTPALREFFEPTPGPEPLQGPQGVVVDRRGETDAVIEWLPVGESEDIDGYLVEYEPTFERFASPKTLNVMKSENRVVLPDLLPGTEYQVRIYTVKGDEQSPPSPSAFTTEIGKPTNLRYDIGTDRITIRWDNPEGDITGTRFEYRQPGTRWRQIPLAADRNRFTLRLPSGVDEMEVRVTAIGRTMESMPNELPILISTSGNDETIQGEPLSTNDVTDNSANIAVNTERVPDDGWVLTLEDEDGIVGSPINVAKSAGTYPLTDLKPGHQYHVSASTKDGAEIGSKNFTTKADKPKNLRTPTTTPTDVTLSWDSPEAPIDGYVIQYRPAGETGDWLEENIEPSETSFTLTELEPETLYDIRIIPTYLDQITGEAGQPGQPSITQITTPPLAEPTPGPDRLGPRPPSNIRFVKVEPNKIHVRWEPSPDTDIDEYSTRLTRVSDGSRVIMSRLPNSYAIFSRLQPNTFYQLAVSAIRGREESEPTVGRVFTGDSAPTNVEVTEATPTDLLVTWEPATPGNPLVTDYNVVLRDIDGEYPEKTMVVSSPETEARFTGLNPGTSYQVSVVPVIEGTTIEPVTTTASTEVPKPERIYFGSVEPTSFIVAWDQPSDLISDYVVTVRPTDSSASVRHPVTGTTNIGLVDLTPGTDYTVSVQSVYMNKTSTETTRTQATPPGLFVPDAPSNVDLSDVTDTSFVVNWQPDGMDHHVRVLYPDGDEFTEVVQAGEDSSFVFDLSPSTIYRVIVTTIGPEGLNSTSTIIDRKTAPAPPTDLVVAEAGDSYLDLTWNDFQNSRRRYLVTWVPELGGDPHEKTVLDTQTKITGLEPDTLYVITVQSMDGQLVSRPLLKSSWTSKAAPLRPPARNIEVEHVPESGTNNYLMTWTSEDNGAYEIRYKPVDADEYSIGAKTNENVNAHTLTGLRPATEYVVNIAPVGVPFDDNAISTYFTTALTGPARVSTSDVTESDVIVEWDAPQLDGVDSFVVKLYPIGEEGDAQVRRVPASSPSILSFTGLEPGRNYQVDVTSVVDGKSSAPTTTYVTTAIQAPTNVQSEVHYDRVIVTWEAPDADVDKYRVTFRPADDVTAATNPEFTQQPTTRYVFTDFQPDTEYLVDVVAMNLYRDIESIPAQGSFRTLPTTATTPVVVETTPVVVETTPASPAPLDSQKTSDGSYMIRWSAPSGSVRYYKVVYVSRTNRQQKELVIPAYLTEVQLNKLLPETDYTVSVVAVMDNDQEVSIGQTQVETNRFAVIELPGDTRVGDEVQSSQHRTADIEWDEQQISFDYYRVTARPEDNSNAEVVTMTIQGGQTSTNLTDLYPGTTYTVTVEGHIGRRFVPVSESVITTAVDPPTNVAVKKSYSESIAIRWKPPRAPITGYVITYQLDGRGSEMTSIPSPGPKARKANIRKLSPGRNYLIRVYAKSLESDSQPAVIWAATAVPAPEKLQVVQATPNVIGLSWEKPDVPITHYTLRVIGPDGVGVSGASNVRLRPTDTSYTVQNLEPGTRYHFSLYAWMNGVASPPAFKARSTARTVSVVSSELGTATDDGVSVSWRGRSRSVDGWKIVVEPQDGSEGYERRVDRLTKSYQLQNLKHGVEYIVKIYPYSGSIVGQPSIITIPATRTRTVTRERVDVTSFPWELRVPSIDSNTLTLRWNKPWFEVQEYSLVYKLRDEPDSAYRKVIPQPHAHDTSATITTLEPGESYVIMLNATSGEADGSMRSSMILNVETLLNPLVGVNMQTSVDGNIVLNWDNAHGITHYMVRYKKIRPEAQTDFIERRLPAGTTTYTLQSLEAGSSYRIEFYGEKGSYRSGTLTFTVDIPAGLPDNCQDPATGETYEIGQQWTTTSGGFQVQCTCHGPQTFDCNTGDWCQTEQGIYNPGDTWLKTSDNNKKEECVCEGRNGYQCFPKNCRGGDAWYDEGATWTSPTDGLECECTCPPARDRRPCQTHCQQAVAVVQNPNFQRNRREPSPSDVSCRGDGPC